MVSGIKLPNSKYTVVSPVCMYVCVCIATVSLELN